MAPSDVAKRQHRREFPKAGCDESHIARGLRDAAEIAMSRGVRIVLLRAIKADIATLLEQPNLSVTTIAARHRIKSRWVQGSFESEGTTFSEYVLAQRLGRAHRLLTDPNHAHKKISCIALDTGFGDLSYFNRAFRRRHGMTPSDLRGIN
jgi:AraC-like DNA-binding protein